MHVHKMYVKIGHFQILDIFYGHPSIFLNDNYING